MKTKFALLLVCIIISIIPSYSKWTKKEGKEFNNATEYRVILETDSTLYGNMEKEEFLEYISYKNGMTPKQLGLSLKYMDSEICKYMESKNQKIYSKNSPEYYTIYIRIDKITNMAGIDATITLSIKSVDETYTFKESVDDGRWNTFDILLQENCEELAKKILKGIKRTYPVHKPHTIF